MSQGESLIAILLAVIAYLLYHIAKQLTYLTGKKLTFRFFPQKPAKKYELPEDKPKSKKEEKLAN